MKKIVQVLYSGFGGHGTVAFSLLDGFASNGLKNHLIFYGIEKINKDYIEQIELNTKVESYFGIQKNTKIGIKEWFQYYKYLKKIKPDIILLHSNQLILVSVIYSLFNKIKIITVEHDAIAVRTKTKWIISNLNAVFANKIVVLSESYKNYIKDNLWFKKLLKKYIVIPNGINTSKYKQKEVYFPTDKITIFMASRMNKLRDHITLIEAVKLVSKKYKNIQLRIAGDGDTLLSLQKKYRELTFVKFLGNIDESKIIKELHLADIYIHATFAETFSTAILHAMSCALPIIVSDIEGTRHMINHKKNGLLFKNKNVLALQNKINILLNDRKLALELGKQAREDVIKKYNAKLIIQKYLKLF